MRMKFGWLRWTCCAALSLALVACDHTPEGADDEPPEVATKKESQKPAPPPAVALGNPLTSLQKRADTGDVEAMVALGRAHEALGGDAQKAEAKKWYEKAAAKGDASAKEALRLMEAQAAAATRAAAEESAATTRPAAVATTAGPTIAAAPPPASSSTTTAPASSGALTWPEVLHCFDNTDFVTVSRPGYRKKPTDNPIFIGLTTAPDKTITVAASGPAGEKLDAVSIVIRLRNRQNVERNLRVQQVAQIANTVTRGNTDPKEIPQWINDYLMSGAKSAPVFRNGWQITVSGTQGEGMRDPREYLGEAVLIEMKK
jgi:hypothetical protein